MKYMFVKYHSSKYCLVSLKISFEDKKFSQFVDYKVLLELCNCESNYEICHIYVGGKAIYFVPLRN